jgi:hypothetical protein
LSLSRQLTNAAREPAISMLCVTERATRLVPELYSPTKSGVSGDLPAVVEALPIADLAANDYAA